MLLTQEQRGLLMPKGHAIIRDRAGWARTYLVQAGLLRAVQRGVFEITDRGRDLLARNHAKIDYAHLLSYPEFQAFSERFFAWLGVKAELPESDGARQKNII